MKNSKSIPRIHKLPDVSLPQASVLRLTNDMPVYWLSLGTQPIIRLEITFEAGRAHEHQRGIAHATAKLLSEGTTRRTADELADLIDFYGAHLNTPFQMDTSGVVLYCLTKHLRHLLPLVAEVLTEPVFAEEEIIDFKQNAIQHHKNNLRKTDVLAYRTLTELLFGAEHPYGYNSTPELYRSIQRKDLLDHHRRQYVSGNGYLILSGLPDSDTFSLLDQYLGTTIPRGGQSDPKIPIKDYTAPVQKRLHKPNARQTAIRIGRPLFTAKHPDAPALKVLDNVLGGFFGSRLMTNIREDKGYTYNIFSSVDHYRHDGIFYIGAEVGNSVVEQAIAEIYKEMQKLIDEPVDAQELNMVKNYMLGNLLTYIDGPLKVAEVYSSLLADGLSIDYFSTLAETIQRITASELQELAAKYLQRSDFTEVVAGAVPN